MNLIDLADIHAAAKGVALPLSSLLKSEAAPVASTRKQKEALRKLAHRQRNLTKLTVRRFKA